MGGLLSHASGQRSFVRIAFLVIGLVPGAAAARRNGINASDCSGCHKGGAAPVVTLTPEVLDLAGGERTRLTLTIDGGAVGGFYLTASIGQLQLVDGEQTKFLGSGVSHSTPKSANGNVVTFAMDWVAPAGEGGVDLMAAVIGGNGNDASSGDGSAAVSSSVAYGCDEGRTYYRDFDGDGFGRDSVTLRSCGLPSGYAVEAHDCDDNDGERFPGNPERCNEKDDDCDGSVDEELPEVMLYPDSDGDGYGTRSESNAIGCGPMDGWGVGWGDCRDDAPAIHPDAMEICNVVDDDCDGRIDDGAQVTCGIGWCRRASPNCDPAFCMPGQPSPETCNYLDDDCDGEVDEDPDMCANGLVCSEGTCVEEPTDPDDGASGQETGSETSTSSDSTPSSSPSGGDDPSSGSTPSAEGGRYAEDSASPLRCSFGIERGRAWPVWAGIGILFYTSRRRRDDREAS